jgi:hypothetical protein
MSRDNNLGLFGLKIVRDIARIFVMCAALMVSPQHILNGGGNSNHDVRDPLRHLVIFSSVTALMIQFV